MKPFKVLFLMLLLSCSANLAAQTFSSEIRTAVSSSTNDAFEYGVAPFNVEVEAFGMNLTETWSQQKIGLRFEQLAIPTGAVIKEAYVQFICRDPEKSTGPSNLLWQSELSANAAPFEATPANISNRQLSANTISWQPDEWRWKEYGGPEGKSPNLAPIIQAVIDQGGWTLNNALAFVITGTGQRSAHNFNSGKPAQLFISFEAPIPTDPISKIYINEIAPNGTTHPDETGDFEDWVELYNDNDFPVNIGGLYFSDKADELDRWQIASSTIIPAKGFALLWADKSAEKNGLHANFALSKNGETLSLAQRLNSDLTIIDQFTYAEVPFKASQARINEEAGNWSIMGEPTPGASNGAGTQWLAAPTISVEEGIFNNAFEVALSHEDPAATIRFTFDGSDPSIFAPVYSSPLTISETSTLKTRAYKDGAAASAVNSKSYLFEASELLPVVMISADPKDLFDAETGIYVEGNGADEVFVCGEIQTANFYQDWERPAHLTFLEPDGSLAFSVDAGIKISGQCSRKYEQKSLNINLRNNQYGSKDIDYELFPNRDRKDYSRLKLRNSGQDYRATMLRDGVNQLIISGETTLESQAYRPTEVYINNEYWGVMNFRERYSSEYFDKLIDDEQEEEIEGDSQIDLLKNQEFAREIKDGDDTHFQKMHDFVLDMDMSLDQNYDFLASQMDINNFIDYWLSTLYISNADWPANNKQIWRPRTEDGKWRWMLIDTDNSTDMTGPDSDQGHRSDKLSKVLQDDIEGWPNDSRSTMIFRKLLTNDNFLTEFIQRGCTFTEIVFAPERVVPIIDQYKGAIDADIEKHILRWVFDNPNLDDKDTWNDNVNKFYTFYQERPPYFYDMLQNNFSLEETFELTFNYSAATDGDVFIHRDERQIPFNYTGSYFKNIPIVVEAKAKEGYSFVEWLETGDTNATINFSSSEEAMLTPIFEKDSIIDHTQQPIIAALNLWPNPSYESINLDTRTTSVATISVYSATTGQLITTIPAAKNSTRIDIKDWTSGTYIVVLQEEGMQRRARFVKL